MTTKANLSGSIVIGSGTNTIKIPVDTALPPTTTGQLVFTYTLPDGQDPNPTISVDEFLNWATTALSLPNFQSSLPTSLTSLSVGVHNLTIDTSGKFDIGVLFGTTTEGKWNPSWTPISGLPFSFNNLMLEVDYASA